MLGGGFIGKMYETNKRNRALLKQHKRKPFEQGGYNASEKTILTDRKVCHWKSDRICFSK